LRTLGLAETAIQSGDYEYARKRALRGGGRLVKE
jgi:hypothetical protein